MKYEVIAETDLSEFIKQVNEYLEEGWQPRGNMIVSIEPYVIPDHGVVSTQVWYYQAIIQLVSEE